MNFNAPPKFRIGFGGPLTQVVKYLLISNIAIYFIQLITFKMGAPLTRFLALHTYQVLHDFSLWQVFTYMFLHDELSMFHIFFNMFSLWIFGCEVEEQLGSKEFLKFYILCGIGGAVLHVLIFANSPQTVVLGASGAIYGVLVAFAVLFPNRVITFLLAFIFPVSIKAKYLVGIFVGISLFSGIVGFFGINDDYAHIVHLGGALVGFLLLKNQDILAHIIRKIKLKQHHRQLEHQRKRDMEEYALRQKVDQILDRINQVGYDNISEEEKRTLKKASDLLAKNESR